MIAQQETTETKHIEPKELGILCNELCRRLKIFGDPVSIQHAVGGNNISYTVRGVGTPVKRLDIEENPNGSDKPVRNFKVEKKDDRWVYDNGDAAGFCDVYRRLKTRIVDKVI